MIRKNQTKAIEGMQATLETETKSKAEALRMKKKLETDVLDLETGLDHANAANQETQMTIQKYGQQVRDTQGKLEAESHAKSAAHDGLVSAERKCNANKNALEEARTLLEQCDRNRRAVEQELSDANEQLSESVVSNQAITAAKRKMEQEMSTLQSELDEMAHEAAMSAERERRLLEAQVKDLVARCDEAETNALKGGRKAVTKMESRIRELESEMDAESRRYADAQKNMRKSERRVKELVYAQEEDKKNHERMQGLIDQLQGKIRSYKKQIEEAEEIAALNLAKYRQVQQNLTGAHERADVSEQALAKAKARSRASSLAPM